MTDYAPLIAPVPWNNTYSPSFCTLLSICATDLAVAHLAPVGIPAYTIVVPCDVNVRAGVLLRREIVARLNTGSLDHSVDRWDPLAGSNPNPTGKQAADRFASAGTVPAGYWGSAADRFSVPVPRKSGLDSSNLFVQADAIANYQSELAAVIAAVPQLVADVAAQAALNTAQDSVVAATVAAALVASRAAYVTSLSATYPSRGYA